MGFGAFGHCLLRFLYRLVKPSASHIYQVHVHVLQYINTVPLYFQVILSLFVQVQFSSLVMFFKITLLKKVIITHFSLFYFIF